MHIVWKVKTPTVGPSYSVAFVGKILVALVQSGLSKRKTYQGTLSLAWVESLGFARYFECETEEEAKLQCETAVKAWFEAAGVEANWA